jgi:hypothetical protein
MQHPSHPTLLWTAGNELINLAIDAVTPQPLRQQQDARLVLL